MTTKSPKKSQKRTGSLQIIDATSKKTWDDFVTSHPEANFLQSWDFYEFHQSRGKNIVRRLAIDQNDHIHGCYAGVVEDAKRGRHLAVAGGPILDWQDQKLVKAIFDDMRERGRALNCVFVRVRPQAEDTEKNRQIFAKNGFKKAPMYLSVEYAGILDLSKTEEEVIAGMRQNHRQAYRKALKNSITVEKSTDPTDIHTFWQIQYETSKRHNFVAFSEDFLTKQFAAFAPNGEAVLYTAKKDGEILSQNFMVFYGDEASFHYAASTALGTKFASGQLLHVEAMRDARARGIGRYNFWGIVGPEEKNHRFYGVSVYKRGFGVQELKYLPAHDLILKKPEYYLKTYLIETLRRKIRHV